MAALVSLLTASFVVGALIGCVGIGGILLIPALDAFTDMAIQEAMATALFTFIFTGILGTYLYQRRRSIDWRLTTPICVGAVLFAYPGAWANALLDTTILRLLLAVIIAFAGIYALTSTPRGVDRMHYGGGWRERSILLLLGGVAGFGSGLTGVGGPVILVPMMVILGFAPLTAVAASQVIQILAGVSGSLGHWAYGTINFTISAWIVVLLLAGVVLGAYIAHAVDTNRLRRIVAWVCIVVAVTLALRAL